MSYDQNVRVVTVRPVNHLKHALLTLATGGLWGFVWGYRVIERNLTR
jgi:hypothetical protein